MIIKELMDIQRYKPDWSGNLEFMGVPFSVPAAKRLRVLAVFVGVLLMVGCTEGGGPGTTVKRVLPAKQGLLPEVNEADAAFTSAHFSGSAACTTCHTDQNEGDAAQMVVLDDAGERDVSIGLAWETSMMANATRDPYWHAVVAAELHQFPNLEDEINDTCTRCHAPMANEFAKKEGITYQVFDSGSEANGDFVQGLYSMDNTSELFNHAMDGVSCTLCHQIADGGNLGEDAGMSGAYVVNTVTGDIKDRPAYGQYSENLFADYMREQSSFTATYAAHISDSATCGTCHNLKTNPVDANGQPVPGVSHFAEQMIYSEWENSIFDDAGAQPTSCQDCHMPKVTHQLVPLTGSSDGRPDFAEHTFLGANTVMQEMMKTFRAELGFNRDENGEFLISEAAFDEAIMRNREFLKTSATVEVQNSTRNGDTLSMDVKITNHTGHKLPSGYHTRRVYLHVLVSDGNGALVYENGFMNSDGSIVGVSEDVNPDSFELHYDKITSATQVQVYQGITGDENGEITNSNLAATRFLKDNRLTPAGFDKNNVSADVAVTGGAKTDTDFNNGSDTVTYEIPVSGSGPFNVLVELRYQPLSYGALQDLFAESDKVPQIDMFRTMYDSIRLRDEVIATTTITLQ